MSPTISAARANGFDAVLGARRGAERRQRPRRPEQTAVAVRDAAGRGALGEVHGLLQLAGPWLVAQSLIRDALTPLLDCVDFGARLTGAFWEQLGCVAGSAEYQLKAAVKERFADVLAPLLDSPKPPSWEEVAATVSTLCEQEAGKLAREALASWAGDARARMGLAEDYERVRSDLGLAEREPITSALKHRDACALLRSFERNHALYGDEREAVYEFERQLADVLRKRAKQALAGQRAALRAAKQAQRAAKAQGQPAAKRPARERAQAQQPRASRPRAQAPSPRRAPVS